MRPILGNCSSCLSNRTCASCRTFNAFLSAAFEQGMWAIQENLLSKEELMEPHTTLRVPALVILDCRHRSACMADRLGTIDDEVVFIVFEDGLGGFVLDSFPPQVPHAYHEFLASLKEAAAIYRRSFADNMISGVGCEELKRKVLTLLRPEGIMLADSNEGLQVGQREVVSLVSALALGVTEMPEFKTHWSKVAERITSTSIRDTSIRVNTKQKLAISVSARSEPSKGSKSEGKVLEVPVGDEPVEAEPRATCSTGSMAPRERHCTEEDSMTEEPRCSSSTGRIQPLAFNWSQLAHTISRGRLSNFGEQFRPTSEQEENQYCKICFETRPNFSMIPLKCACAFCRDCLRQHFESVTFPRCPTPGCGHEVTEQELIEACGRGERLERFHSASLARAVDCLPGVFRCCNPECSNVIETDASHGRVRFSCSCGAPAICTGCRSPYHYHVPCGQVEMVTRRWLDWITQGRQQYHGDAREFARSEERRKAVQDVLTRQSELRSDEQWKARHCRLCPKCKRPIQKIDGCNSMVCGENYHGGAKQPGCGHRFSFDTAPQYQAAMVENSSAPAQPTLQLRGARIRHHFVNCNACGDTIIGLRLRCIHCADYDLCTTCDLHCSSTHPVDHVFELLDRAECDLTHDLPKGTKIVICNGSRWDGFDAEITQPQGSDMYQVRITAGSHKDIELLHCSELQPVVKSDEEALQLMEVQQRQRMRERKRLQLEQEKREAEEALRVSILFDFQSNPVFCCLSAHEQEAQLEHAVKEALREVVPASPEGFQPRNVRNQWVRTSDDGPRCRTEGCNSSSYIIQEDGYCAVCNVHKRLEDAGTPIPLERPLQPEAEPNLLTTHDYLTQSLTSYLPGWFR